ncbi:MAG: helix-turn-helix domain-containing protein [Alphaproteobacteria bacterium]|nr:helix-turn-helix domain-containing protein [Alphaproteobacteria bacterium]
MSSREQAALKRFGKTLQSQRKRAGLTQEQLAEFCDFDPTYISLLERGKRNPSLIAMTNLAHSLKCKVEDLVDGM